MCLVTQLCLTLFWPRGLKPERHLCPWGFSKQEYRSGLACPPPRDLPNPEIKPRSLTLQAESLPAETPGKSRNTGVGNPSLLQGIFPTQESNQGLLHCRWILYHLSCQRSPLPTLSTLINEGQALIKKLQREFGERWFRDQRKGRTEMNGSRQGELFKKV